MNPNNLCASIHKRENTEIGEAAMDNKLHDRER